MKKIKLLVGGKDLLVEVSAFNNKQHVAITPICEAIGIRPHGQAARLQNNPQFSPTLICAPSNGGAQEMLMLPLEEVGMWLCNINSARVKESVKEVLIAFQRHCQVELHAAITGMAGTDRVSALEKQVADLSAQLTAFTAQMGKMLDVVCQQQATIDHLTNIIQPMANAEKHIASIGGKFMAIARGTKKMRDTLQ